MFSLFFIGFHDILKILGNFLLFSTNIAPLREFSRAMLLFNMYMFVRYVFDVCIVCADLVYVMILLMMIV